MMSLLPSLVGVKAGYFLAHGMLIGLPTNSHISIGYPHEPVKNFALCQSLEQLSKESSSNDPVALYEGKFHFMARSVGHSLFPCFRKAIYLDRGLIQLDMDTALWHLRHQFCLLNNRGHIFSKVAFGVSCLAWYSLFSFPLAFSGGFASYCCLNKLIKSKIYTYAEREALAQATEAELKGAIRFYKAALLARRELTNLVSSFNEMKVKMKREGGDFRSRLKEAIITLRKRFGATKEEVRAITKDDRVERLRQHILFGILEDLDDDICIM
jgi:hypothetical protein